ncbi:haloalkane dehalogenase [Nannocystis radixulma]|uniref:Haloalkane dehalogenase n=1 Tax=Nannocystis radixulma TaxID=2995305 RepID=A0ABT5BJS0_9BACT|nr:haloalkane dehalogenase [Nannocystis radixulma]MDC0674400.1 haloalkane dehalogenase [Nannocystis radixulma]
MHRLRTPDERFADLPDFAHPPRYVEVPAGDGDAEPLRMHYVDVGPRDGAVVLLLHGEPTWSFLYRHALAALAAAGMRAVAPDLIGFGRSDKPAATGDYTYQRHVDWLRAFLAATGIADLSLVCQDWGGLLGLRLAGETPAMFRRIVAMNTFLPTGDEALPEAFHRWREFSQKVPELPVGAVVQGGSAQPLAPAVVAAYDAPFPDARYKAGARVFPTLVPIVPDDPASAANRRAWDGLRRYDRPFLTLFGARDPITQPAQVLLQAAIPGARDQPHRVFERAGHFLQEDLGAELGQALAQFLRP